MQWPWTSITRKPPVITKQSLTTHMIQHLKLRVLEQMEMNAKLEVKNDRLMETIKRQTRVIKHLKYRLSETEENQ